MLGVSPHFPSNSMSDSAQYLWSILQGITPGLRSCRAHVQLLGRTQQTLTSFFSTHQYDAVPIQPSVVLCSCPSPSMVRTHADSSTAPGGPSSGSRQGPAMDGTAADSRPSASALQHAAQPPRKKRPEDFKFGKILGEGSFSTVSNPQVSQGSSLRITCHRTGPWTL